MFSNNWNYIQIIDSIAITWIIISILCAIYVAWDQFKNNPEPVVMKWGFVLVTLYMGPIGLIMYVLADKEPAKGTHEEFTKPLWKQGIGSTIHCVAGDATGIIVAAIIVTILGIPMWLDLWIEYVAGFLFGWFIFQSLFMKNMMGGSYWSNVKSTFFPEFISMNSMMAGMAPVMVFLMMGRDMRAMDPAEPLFWLTMSISITGGFAVAYPVNVWMVKKGMKHGLMTLRKGTEQKDGKNHQEHSEHMQHAHGKGQEGHMQHSHGKERDDHMQHSHGKEHGDHMQHSKGGGHQHHGKNTATRPQITALTLVTSLMLLGGIVIPGAFVNTNISAKEVEGAVMPPGMVVSRTQSADAMKDMSAVLPNQVTKTANSNAKGDKPITPKMENGYKVIDLTTSVIRWNILPDRTVDAYAFNEQVPGPQIRITEGDNVKIRVKNNLPEATTVHWHGLILENEMDGPAEVTQKPIQPGETYTYTFEAVQNGTYFYHSHKAADRQQGLGLYGSLIIDPKDPADAPEYDVAKNIALQEWLVRDGITYPAMLMEGALPNYFTINGKSYPETETLNMKVGERALFRFIGSNNNFIHPMHIHGGPFEVVARDGETLKESARFEADTVNVGPGQRYDVVWTALKPGKWLLHCHIPHHTTNDNTEEKGGGGLTMVINVTE